MNQPCKNCDMRYLGCHSSCQEYIEYTKELKKANDKRKLERQARDVAFQMSSGHTAGLKKLKENARRKPKS